MGDGWRAKVALATILSVTVSLMLLLLADYPLMLLGIGVSVVKGMLCMRSVLFLSGGGPRRSRGHDPKSVRPRERRRQGHEQPRTPKPGGPTDPSSAPEVAHVITILL